MCSTYDTESPDFKKRCVYMLVLFNYDKPNNISYVL